MARVNVLRNLKIREISSVDRGAGKGVRVMLMKRRSTSALTAEAETYLKRNVITEAETVAKREFSPKERESAAARGQAMAGGGFPIQNASDLGNAIQAFGRAKDPVATKAHIRRRAAALGLTDRLPASWSKKKAEKNLVELAASLGEAQFLMKNACSFVELLSEMASPAHPMGVIQAVKTAGHALKDSIRSIDECDELGPTEKAAEIASSYRQFMDHLAGIAPVGVVKATRAGAPKMSKLSKKLAKAFTSVGQGTPKDPPAKSKDTKDDLAKDPADGTGMNPPKTAVDKKIAKIVEKAEREAETWKRRAMASISLDKASKDFMDHPDNDMDDEEKCKFLDATPTERAKIMEDRPIAKMTEKRIASLPEDVRKQLEAGNSAAADVAKMRENAEVVEFAKRANDLGQPAEFGKSLRLLAKGIGTDEERAKAFEEVEKLLKGYAEQARIAGVFKEFGSARNQATEGSAEAQIYAKRDELLADVAKSGAKMTPEQAFAKVYEDPANRALVDQYKQENRRRAA